MTLTAAVEAELSSWVDAYTGALEDLKTESAAVAESAWLSFGGWYSAAAVTTTAAELADLSATAQQTATGMAAQYVESVLAAFTARAPVLPAPRVPQVRNGADLTLVHTRPAEAFRQAIATGKTEDEAVEIARQRATGLMLTDVSLASRQTERDHYAAAGITGYRRIIRPELSESGSCGLCIVATDRIYSIGDLMPIHPPHCKCVSMAIKGEDDPGRSLNDQDLKALYKAAGSTGKQDLAKVRVKVSQHGEFGPILSRKGDQVRTQARVALENDPSRAARMLEKARPTLNNLEARAAAGDDVASPLTYQRQLVARLERITRAAA